MKYKLIITIFTITLLSTNNGISYLTIKDALDRTRSAQYIRAVYGGSGLGYCAPGGWTEFGNREAVSPSPQCCQDACYCGKLSKVKNFRQICSVYVAAVQASYTHNGETGEINATTVSEVQAHEYRHVAIREHAAERANNILNSRLPSVVSSPKASDASAQSAVLALAPFVESIYKVAYGDGAQKSEHLDNFEGAGVDEGIWRMGAHSSAMSIIFSEIDSISSNYQLPTDNSASDCQ